MTTVTEALQVRPEVPRRAWSMAAAMTLAVAAGVAGAAAAIPAYGALWGLIASAALIVALRMGHVPVGNLDRALLIIGLTASTVLATRILPFAPQDVDVLLCVRFATAWAPAAFATAVVLARLGVRPTSVINAGVAWLLGGAFSLPAAVTLGVLTPISSLRRGVEPVFGAGDYMAIGLIVFAVGSAAFLAAVTRLPALATTAVVVLLTVFAGSSVGFTIPGLIENIANIVNIPNFWPPDFGWAIGEGTWWWLPSWEFGAPLRANPMVETIRMGVIASVLGCAIALPLAFMASTLTAINRPVYLAAKGFMNVTRTIPDLFWAAILVASVGGGPFAGAVALTIFSMAIMSKLFSETIDGAEPGPLEAAKATGSRHFPALRSSVLPQVLPNYVAYALYIFELTIRASAIVGLVGAGGIGRVLEAQRVFYRYDRIMAMVIVIVVVVFVLEQISVAMRRRLV